MMSDLHNIVENIKNKNLEQALKLCDVYENNKNKHVILNFRGVIYLFKEKQNLAEASFIESSKLNEKYEDPIKNLYILYLKKNFLKNFYFVQKN